MKTKTKRLTLLLTDDQIRIIKSRAALAGMTGSEWVVALLNLDKKRCKDILGETGGISDAHSMLDELEIKKKGGLTCKQETR